jgi:hypothetical protein
VCLQINITITHDEHFAHLVGECMGTKSTYKAYSVSHTVSIVSTWYAGVGPEVLLTGIILA